MRLKYYILSLKKMRQMKLKKKPFVFFLIIILFLILLVVFFNKRVHPYVKSLCNITAQNLALNVTNETVDEYIKTITYDSLMNINKDASGKIISMDADVMEMNRLSTSISTAIQEKIKNVGNKKIKIPLGTILNWGIFSGYGPNISIEIIPSGIVTAKFKSEFEQAGINQTRHRIYIEVNTSMYIVAPFYVDTQTYTNEITVAETILVGDIPSTNYNINGLNENQALEVIK